MEAAKETKFGTQVD